MAPSTDMRMCRCGCGKPAKSGEFLRGHHFRGQPLKTREEKLDTRRAYQSTHREQIRQAQNKWREANPELVQNNRRRFRANHDATIKQRQKAYRESEAGRAYNAAYTRVYYANPVNRMRLLVNGAIGRAQKAGLPFDESLRDRLMDSPPVECACCHAALDYSMRRGNRSLSPSLDRFEPAKGYTNENVVVICMRCNEVKGNASIREVEAVLAYMRSRS